MTTTLQAPAPETEPIPLDGYDGQHNSPPPSRPVVIRLTPEHVRTFHRSIPILVHDARRRLGAHRAADAREVVLDVSGVPPRPMAAPLLFLVRLLRRLADVDGRVEVTGMSPALAAALTPFDLPEGVTLTDTKGHRWPPD
jgi:hypothetical protein